MVRVPCLGSGLWRTVSAVRPGGRTTDASGSGKILQKGLDGQNWKAKWKAFRVKEMQAECLWFGGVRADLRSRVHPVGS